MGRNGEDLCSVIVFFFSPQVQPVSVRNQTAEDFITSQGVPELLLQPAAWAGLRGGAQKLMGAWQTSSSPAVTPGTRESIGRSWNSVCLHLCLYCFLSTKSQKGSLHWFVLTEGRRGGEQRKERRARPRKTWLITTNPTELAAPKPMLMWLSRKSSLILNTPSCLVL